MKTKSWYIISDYGHGDRSIVHRNLSKKEAVDLLNKETRNNNFESFEKAYAYTDGIYRILSEVEVLSYF